MAIGCYLENSMIIEAQYKWNGELSGYREDNRFIPLDPRNVDFQKIQQAISDGQCSVAEPALGQISQANDRHGNCSGYHTRFGFVPNYADSHLLKLIDEQLADGRCVLHNPATSAQSEPEFKIQKLIFSIIFDQQWTNVSAPFFGELPYASHAKAEQRLFKFTIDNLKFSSSDKLQLLLKKHGVNEGFPISIYPAQFGLIEIEVPVAELRHLFKGEQRLINTWMLPFHADLLQQHFAQTRRKPKEGPDILWLISHVNLYMSHFVAEFCNKVIEAFRMEYGSNGIQYFSEKNDGYKTVVLSCSESGDFRFQSLMAASQNQSFNLSGEWHSSYLLRYEEQTKSIGFYQKTALSRVAEMVRLGFHAEALGPLNAFFEVVIRWALVNCVKDSVQHSELVLNSGHGYRLSILESMVNAGLDSYICDDYFQGCLLTIKTIYKNRNYYLHALQLPEVTGRLTLMDRRRLEDYFHGFLDVWEQNQFFMRLNGLANDQGVVRDLVKREIDRRLDDNKI